MPCLSNQSLFQRKVMMVEGKEKCGVISKLMLSLELTNKVESLSSVTTYTLTGSRFFRISMGSHQEKPIY